MEGHGPDMLGACVQVSCQSCEAQVFLTWMFSNFLTYQ